MDTGEALAAGGCLCGAVRYEIHGSLRDVVNCHCGQCRRSHGHYAAYSATAKDDLEVVGSRGLKWYRSSDRARRGFCGTCGSSLFWEPSDGAYVAIAAGTLDAPTGLKTIRHIYTAFKGDYYRVDDGLERLAGSMGQS